MHTLYDNCIAQGQQATMKHILVPILCSITLTGCMLAKTTPPPLPQALPTRETFLPINPVIQSPVIQNSVSLDSAPQDTTTMWKNVDSGLKDRTVYTQGSLSIIITQTQNGETNCDTLSFSKTRTFSSPNHFHQFFRGTSTDDGKEVTCLVCEKRSDGLYYSPTSYGNILYYAPSKSNEQELQKMDDFIQNLSETLP